MPHWERPRKQPAPPKAQAGPEPIHRVWKGAYLGEKVGSAVRGQGHSCPSSQKPSGMTVVMY